MNTSDQQPCGCPLRQDVIDMMGISPHLALALAEGKRFIPYVFVVSDSWTTTGSPAPLLNVNTDPTNINQDVLILSVDVDIQTKDFNTGAILKPEADLAYDLTSGIQCDVRITGFQATSTPYFPLKALPSFGGVGSGVGGAFRRPWALLADQEMQMDFSVTTPLPSDSTVITCTFTCTTPAQYKYAKDRGKVFDRLAELGYGDCVDVVRSYWCAG